VRDRRIAAGTTAPSFRAATAGVDFDRGFLRIAARGIKAAVEKAELGDGVTAHTLRHGFGSMLIRLGLDPVTVSKQMGHKNANVTLAIYAHEFEQQRTADDTRTRLADGFGHLLAARS